MVLFKEGDTEEEAVSELYKDVMEAKDKLTSIGQVLNDKNKLLFKAKQEREYGTSTAQITK
eukprot:10866898-Heterocapsa_arctica.AAC.1